MTVEEARKAIWQQLYDAGCSYDATHVNVNELRGEVCARCTEEADHLTDALIEAVRGEHQYEYDLAVEGWQQRGNQHEQALERIEQLEGALRRIDALDLVEMRRQGIDGDIGEAAQGIALAALASRAP